VLFIMTDDTKNCDEVAEFLQQRYPDLRDAVLTIHTKNNGELSESPMGKNKDELNRLRALSSSIDDASNPYKAIVSVMMLREGWDVQNVVTVVGLRPFKAKSQILPEQALGRGLRRMFRGEDVKERVSVVGTDAFISFVEQIKVEGVELEYAQMGGARPTPKSPLVVEIDRDNPDKDIEKLDIELPVLAPRIYREYKDLESLDPASLTFQKVQYLQFTADEQREIVFRNIDTDATSHITQMQDDFEPNYQSMIAYVTNQLIRDLRLVGGQDILFGKLRDFVANDLFDRPVDLEDPNTLRNLSEDVAVRTLMDAFKTGINALIVRDRGTTEIRDSIKLSRTRPYVATNNPHITTKKSVFNKTVPDQGFELEVARFLDDCDDIVSWAKNTRSVGFQIEYQTAGGGIAPYYPDFLVKTEDDVVWVIETKGREDLDDPPKWDRLQEWCYDASEQDLGYEYKPRFIREEDWAQYTPASFEELARTFE
jgi:type III restriction enzyme